jgi:two-component system, cell cycle response regulator
MMMTTTIFDRIAEVEKLLAPSPVVQDIIHMVRTKTVDPDTLAARIATDQRLADDLLQYAHSAILVPDRAVISLRRMIAELDICIVVALALGFSLLSTKRAGKCQGFDYMKFWSSSLAKAVSARAITEMQNKFNPDEMFVCGLLSDIGILAFAHLLPEEYGRIIGDCTNENEILIRERERFGVTHLDLTADILQKWGLPEQYSLVVKFHENPNSYNFPDTRSFEISRLLYLSLLLSKILILEFPLIEKLNQAEQLAEQYNIPENEFGPFFDRLVYHYQEWSRVFQVPSPQCSLYDQIRAMEGGEGEDPEPASHTRKVRILAVDDDPLMLISLEKILSGGGKEILTAENGEEALNIALEKQPHMVITDWRMPKMNGLELCRILRRTSLTQHTYIIMVTCCTTDDELVQAFDAGVDDFITKPFSPKVLEARVQSGERLIRYQKTVSHDRQVIQKYATQLTSANRKLQTMAMADPLTGLPNRRSAMKRLSAAVAETVRHGEKLSCIMIDIDHFKKVNDTHGHESGDLVLKAMASTFHRRARMYDIVSRTGGEEFLVICARSDLLEAQQLAERLRVAVADLQIDVKKASIRVTISLGVASWRPEFTDGDTLIRAADGALYKAKKNGRNRVELADNISAV